jgi:microcystin degradation protein MlrC
MRIFISSLYTETNTLSPIPTGLRAFEEYGLIRDASRRHDVPAAVPLGEIRRLAQACGDEVIEGLSASAQPAGKTVRAAYEKLREAILVDLRAAQEVAPLDMILLALHGAMVADGYDDCEGDLIAHVRAIAPAAVIGVQLDLHCHLTDAMVRDSDVIIAVKEYPHIDMAERAHELFHICRRTVLGEINPVAALVATHMIGAYPTFDAPMSGIVGNLRAAEARSSILTASIAHGFAWADVPEVGTKVLVYADADLPAAMNEAGALSKQIYDAREELLPRYPDIAASLDRATALSGLVVLGDFADNPGGGAAGDSTYFLRELLARGIRNAVVGCFWDPVAVEFCAEAGIGAMLEIRLGGKCGVASGEPIDLTVQVLGLREHHDQGCFGFRQQLGRAVWIRSQGIDIAVCSVRSQVFDPDAFTGLGISLESRRLIVVKSSAHYQARFSEIADHLWHVRTPGAMSLDFAAIPYLKRDGNYFPRVQDPWALLGRPEPRTFVRRRALA